MALLTQAAQLADGSGFELISTIGRQGTQYILQNDMSAPFVDLRDCSAISISSKGVDCPMGSDTSPYSACTVSAMIEIEVQNYRDLLNLNIS